jgi:tRNA(Ile2) C34 agmatinyltransferase TiaS
MAGWSRLRFPRLTLTIPVCVTIDVIGRVEHLCLGEFMPSSEKPTVPSLEMVKPPRCAMCRTRMELAGREPGANGAEKYTFKCPKCEFSKTKISNDPTNAGRYRAPRKR